MIRDFHLADWFTLGNAVCRTGALFSSMSYLDDNDVLHIYLAVVLVFLALVFGVLDGRIARWRQKASLLDQRAGFARRCHFIRRARMIIGYGCGMRGLYDRMILAYFVACGVSRLARYNVTTEEMSSGTGKVTHFEGTPMPTSFAIMLRLGIAGYFGAVGQNLWLGKFWASLHPLTLV